jgi:hypothetical protein
LNRAEKEKNWKAYRDSERYTTSTYIVILTVSRNITRMTHLAELYSFILNRLDSGSIKHAFSESEVVEIKQMIVVDILSKIMISIESLLAFCDSFSHYRPYKSLPKRMVRYDLQTIKNFILKIENDKVNLWKTIGLPNISALKRNCKLTEGETRVLGKALTDSCDYMKRELNAVIDFYESNRILYGKFRHGLLFMPGLSLKQVGRDSPNSAFIAFDKQDYEPKKICFQGKDIKPIGLDWFNTYTILPYGNHVLNKYIALSKKLVELSEFILWNHLFHAFNCGEDYLPMKIRHDGTAKIGIYLSKKLKNKQWKEIKAILNKVSKNTYFPPVVDAKIEFNFSEEKFKKLVNCLNRNQVATIYKRESGEKQQQG